MAKSEAQLLDDMRWILNSAFEMYYNEEVEPWQYREFVREIQADHPDIFEKLLEMNTDVKNEQLNAVNFADEVLPIDKAVVEKTNMGLDVPFGMEQQDYLVDYPQYKQQLKGLADSKKGKLYVAGQTDPVITQHEGTHLLSNTNIGTEYIEPDGVPLGNELLARSMDLLRGYASGDEALVKETVDFIDGQFSEKEMLDIAMKALNQFYDTGLIQEDPAEYVDLSADPFAYTIK